MGIELFARDLEQILFPAYRLVVIGMDAVGGGRYFLAQDVFRLVFRSLPLGDDDSALCVDLVRIEHRSQHAVRLDLQGQLSSIAGERRIVGRIVMTGHGIDIAALTVDGAHDRALGELA